MEMGNNARSMAASFSSRRKKLLSRTPGGRHGVWFWALKRGRGGGQTHEARGDDLVIASGEDGADSKNDSDIPFAKECARQYERE